MSRARIFLVGVMTLVLAACSAPPLAQPEPGNPPANSSPSNGEKDVLDEIRTAGVMRVSTDANYAPQSLFDAASKSWTGFDIEVAREIGRRLGVNVEFVTPEWTNITAGGWARQWDVSVGSMTVTNDRVRVLDFTQPYYYAPAQFAVRNDLRSDMQSAEALSGRTVCVAEATTYEQYLQGKLVLRGMSPVPQNVHINVVKTDAECIQALQSGRKDIDAVLTSWNVIENGMKQGAPIEPLGPPVYYEDLAIAIDKSAKPNSRFLAALEQIIKDMQADGTLTSLSVKYFGFDLTKPAL